MKKIPSGKKRASGGAHRARCVFLIKTRSWQPTVAKRAPMKIMKGNSGSFSESASLCGFGWGGGLLRNKIAPFNAIFCVNRARSPLKALFSSRRPFRLRRPPKQRRPANRRQRRASWETTNSSRALGSRRDPRQRLGLHAPNHVPQNVFACIGANRLDDQAIFPHFHARTRGP